ncbi:MFS transporter [Tepidibacillus fermentans]|uniref:YQGE family putative transporter n=1 Tax=Tepidibacillus fermentans TaxID=1281767 RepID=A0A4R3KIU5_9BACI|nr:MFS transporter [Tepidibacillus fermentans]TCS83505.1 YQGE family putative transporter [Tepidibacillus fermentans]
MEQKIHHKLSHKMKINHPKILNKDARLLLLVSTLYTIAIALSNTFVNVYLWKLEKNYILIGWFNFSQYLTTLIIFVLAGKLSKNLDRVILLRIGVVILTIFYLVVLVLGSRSAEHSVLLGSLLGIGQGFYWFSFNHLYFEITTSKNRDIFNGWNGLFTSAGGIVAPFLSGWFISHKPGFTGYRLIFFISLFVFLLAVMVSFLFYKRPLKGRYRLTKVLKQSITQTPWRNISLGMMAQGGREGVITFLTGLLVYISTNNEFSLGTYSMLISLVALVSYFLAGKWMKKVSRNRSMMIGSLMMAVVVIPMFLKTSYTTLLIYGIGTSLFAPLYFIPLTSVVFDFIGKNEETVSLRSEYIVLREIGSNLGRMMILLVFIVFIKWVGLHHLRYILLISGTLQVVTWLSFRKVLASS